MKDLLKLTTEAQDPEVKPGCKGRIYRYRESAYFHQGKFGKRVELVPLKRQSCSGCDECDWLDEYLAEDIAQAGEIPPVPMSASDGDALKLVPFGTYDDVEFRFDPFTEA